MNKYNKKYQFTKFEKYVFVINSLRRNFATRIEERHGFGHATTKKHNQQFCHLLHHFLKHLNEFF